MSLAHHLQTPQPRTEVDVAPAAIVAILDARIVPKTAGMIGRLSMVAGVPVADIKRVGELKKSGCRAPLPTRRPMADETTADPVQRTGPAAPGLQPKSQGGVAHRSKRFRPSPITEGIVEIDGPSARQQVATGR
jgi:hypothetical protein